MNELNRDLLVAVLAVLTDTVPEDGLAAILDSWSQKRQTPLAQLLKRVSGVDDAKFHELEIDRKSTRLNSSHLARSRMPSSA